MVGNHCYYHNEMRPHTIGRALGISLRVAGRIAGEKITQSSAASAQATPVTSPPAVRRTPKGSLRAGIRRGVSGFLRPFRRVGSILWLEVTGSFFLLFAVLFSQYLWRMRDEFQHPRNPAHLWVTVAATAIFLYLGLSSFWRARRR